MSLKLAIDQARLNPIFPKGRNSISRFATVLTNGKLIFVGLNSYKTHTLQKKFSSNEESIHIHSEVDAIVKATRHFAQTDGRHYTSISDLSDFKMFVARVLKDGTPANSKPCIGCQRALAAFGITQVEWIE